MEKPNILYIHSHDTGRYIEPYGHKISTPNMLKLAGEGVLFRQAFCAAPTCSPSRACLLTGTYAHENGMLGLAHRGFSLNDYGDHILHTLQGAGYHSALSGVQHIANDPALIGYDEVLYAGGGESAQTRAVEFLAQKPSQPFFLSVGFSETHRAYPELGPDEVPAYCLPPMPIPDTPETREDMARFKAAARVFDGRVGAVLDALESASLDANTLVICTTDHGIAFPRMKCNLTDGGMGVMLIMRLPGLFPAGMVVDSMVSHVDIFPTVCELAGVPAPQRLRGVSLMPLIRGETASVRDEVFAEVNYHAAYEPKRCVRTERWKYIRRFDSRLKPVLPNCDDSPSKTVWIKNGWKDTKLEPEELYDLVFDPGETNNLASKPQAREILAEMRARLDKWMKDTDDPLLTGPVQAPTGARINDPDGVSPQELPMSWN